MREYQQSIDRSGRGKRPFVEYVQFEDDTVRRVATKRAFMEGVIYAPRYGYPNLNDLVFPGGSIVDEERREFSHLVSGLEADRLAGRVEDDECRLYIGTRERSLKKLMLAGAALQIRQAATRNEKQEAQREFSRLNRELYGDMNEDIFAGIMHTEQQRVGVFIPQNFRASAIKRSLDTYFLVHSFEGNEGELLDQELLFDLQQLVQTRYRSILAAVPDTGDDIRYDAWQCRDIMTTALGEGGIGTWSVEVNPLKDVPATNDGDKKIVLPGDTLRTAPELRRLILHEQEVHVRRTENGTRSRVGILGQGTPTYGGPEEGLGVLLECAHSGSFDNPSYYRARDRYVTAGIALGLDGNPKDARAAFGLMWRLIALRLAVNGTVTKADERAAKAQAMTHIDNAFRGTNFRMPGIVYTKLKLYYEGLLGNISYFLQHRDTLPAALDQALIGKYNHTDVTETAMVTRLIQKKLAVIAA